jgi:hypothetical protein
MNRFIIAIIIAALSFQVMAGPKPIKGKYSCKGIATKTLEVSGLRAGYQWAKVKGKMTVSRYGWSELYVLNSGWQAAIVDQYPTAYTPSFKTSSNQRASRILKEMTRECSIMIYAQNQEVYANKNGRKAIITATQQYVCRGGAFETDKYELTCKR